MSRRWENKEVPGRGTKYCLVIDPEDGTHPIRTYGWTVEEVLDKVAKTTETAQQVINRQRTATPQVAATSSDARSAVTSVAPAPRNLTAEEQMQATSDLSNPSKSPQALRTLLRGVGVDVDRMKLDEDVRRITAIAQEWESHNPDWPSSDKNNRLLLDKATLMAGFPNITSQTLDAAYRELSSRGMIFEVESEPQSPTPPDATNGNSVTRNEGQTRTATTYRSHSLRSDVVVAPTKPRYTRTELDAMTSRQLREKIEHEPGFREWYESFSRAATA